MSERELLKRSLISQRPKPSSLSCPKALGLPGRQRLALYDESTDHRHSEVGKCWGAAEDPICRDLARMEPEPFSWPENPAADIRHLVQYLTTLDDGSYLYRGQVKFYKSPLLPSAFRGILGDSPVIVNNDADASHSLRHLGQRFVGNYVWDLEDHHLSSLAHLPDVCPSASHLDSASRDADAYFSSHFSSDGSLHMFRPAPPTALEEFINSLTNTVEFNSLVAKDGPRKALRLMLLRKFPDAEPDHPYLNFYIDRCHRRQFSKDILINACGFLIGSLLSRHYGFSSGLLDVTSSVEVAAFFETHSSPDYMFVGMSPPTETGVIYRFGNTAPHVKASANYSYYEFPGTLTAWRTLEQIEGDVSHKETLQSLSLFRTPHTH